MKGAAEEKRGRPSSQRVAFESCQPAGAPSPRWGPSLHLEGRRGFSSEGSPPRSPTCPGSSPQVLGSPDLAGAGRGDPSRQKGGGGVVAGPGSQGCALAKSDFQRPLPGAERNSDCEPAPKGRSSGGEAAGPGVEAGCKPSNMSFILRRFLPVDSDASWRARERPASSSPKPLEQSKVEVGTSVILETDKTLPNTNPLEAELKALGGSSHPCSSQFLQALQKPVQLVNELLAENQQLRKELNNSEAFQVRSLQAQVKQLQQELLRRQDGKGVSEHHLKAENQRLQRELHTLQELRDFQEAVIASLRTETQELQEELEALRRRMVPERETIADETPVPQMTAFSVQVRITGETHGYEKQFLGDLNKLLAGHKVSLQVEDCQEDTGHLLLLFCTVVSREGTDIDNALKGLKSTQKALLVVLHYKQKNTTKFFADVKPQVLHSALVGTVHACFSTQDGFYHCQTNQDAVESVAAVILQQTQDC